MILYGGFLKSTQSGIYIFALANIGGNAFQMALSTFYLGPISIMQDFLFSGGQESFGAKFLSYLFLAQWYEEMFIQIIIAVDR
uniref:Uncharacterized protein n=1 Tax=Acrobeloides nanus TaxID=290746 RepID=A0A914DLH6_9BILA